MSRVLSNTASISNHNNLVKIILVYSNQWQWKMAIHSVNRSISSEAQDHPRKCISDSVNSGDTSQS